LASLIAAPAAADYSDMPEREGIRGAGVFSGALKTTSTSGFETSIDRYASAAGVPAALARAVMRIESRGNPGVTGRAGEVGLMQIKHQTARGMGFSGSRAELYQPEVNLQWGTRYLAEAYRLAGGDTCRTVLKYQGGHGANRMTGAASAYCARVRAIMASN
jgi:soluble lytic murein transglycosylase-like protein